jgi:DNA primase
MRERDTAELLMQRKQMDAPVQIDWPEMALPKDSYPVKNYPVEKLDEKNVEHFVKACEFLVERGLDNWTDWHYSTFSHFRNRVILPFRYKGKIVGYTARWVGTVPNKETTKYYVQQPKNFVYGLDRSADKKITIVTEGQLDAVSIDGVAIGSNNMSLEQSKIIEKTGNRIILLPDADAAGLKLVRQAIQRGWSVSFPPWEPDVKDANDAVQKYGKLFTVKSILDFSIDNSTKAEVMAKSYCK